MISLIYFASTVFGQGTLEELCPVQTDPTDCFVMNANGAGDRYAVDSSQCIIEFCNAECDVVVVHAMWHLGCWAPADNHYPCSLECHQHPASWYRCTGDYTDNPPEYEDLIKVKTLKWDECSQDTSGGVAWQKDLRYKASTCDGIIYIYAAQDSDCANHIATLNYDVSEAVTSVDGSDDPKGMCTDLTETDLSGNSVVRTQSDVICIQTEGLSITLNGCRSQVGLLLPLPATFDLSIPERECLGYPNSDFVNFGVISINICDNRCDEARQKGTDDIQGCCMHTPDGCFFNENINDLQLGAADSFAGLAERPKARLADMLEKISQNSQSI